MGAALHHWWNDTAIFRAIAPHKRFVLMQRPELIIQRCSYLGGLSNADQQVMERGNMIKIQQDGISLVYIGSAYPKVLAQIHWPAIADLEIQDDDAVDDRLTSDQQPKGGVRSHAGKQKAGAILQVTSGGNRVRFRTLSMSAEELRTALAPLLEAMESQRQLARSAPTSTAESKSAAATVPSSLRELTELHEQGALTDEEFAAAKQRVLES